ncbi:MAG TPA: hypothetical protein PKA63_12440 [Oligoflexia bacterium]|nr:hypothetical protein [Oligoflexia bacterium]
MKSQYGIVFDVDRTKLGNLVNSVVNGGIEVKEITSFIQSQVSAYSESVEFFENDLFAKLTFLPPEHWGIGRRVTAYFLNPCAEVCSPLTMYFYVLN